MMRKLIDYPDQPELPHSPFSWLVAGDGLDAIAFHPSSSPQNKIATRKPSELRISAEKICQKESHRQRQMD